MLGIVVGGESPGMPWHAMALDVGGQFLPAIPGDFFHHAHLAERPNGLLVILCCLHLLTISMFYNIEE